MKVFQVGGSVRDELLGIEPKDRDWVVVNSSPEEMENNGFKPIGKDFPVFLHPKTNEEYEDLMTISEMESLIKKKYIKLLPPTQMNIVSSVGSVDSKTDSGFKEVLSKAAEAHPNSPLAERYGRKSVKQTQIDRVRKKHINRKLKGGGR